MGCGSSDIQSMMNMETEVVFLAIFQVYQRGCKFMDYNEWIGREHRIRLKIND
jgi:hypothetical protein